MMRPRQKHILLGWGARLFLALAERAMKARD